MSLQNVRDILAGRITEIPPGTRVKVRYGWKGSQMAEVILDNLATLKVTVRKYRGNSGRWTQPQSKFPARIFWRCCNEAMMEL